MSCSIPIEKPEDTAAPVGVFDLSNANGVNESEPSIHCMRPKEGRIQTSWICEVCRMTQVDLFAGSSGVSDVRSVVTEKVIPFGKYKDQPYEVLLADSSYALWLMGSMFAKLQANYPALLAFLISRYGVPDRTPDHNRLQNRFLEPVFALKFAFAAGTHLWCLLPALEHIDLSASWQRYVKKILADEVLKPGSLAQHTKGDRLSKVMANLLDQASRLAFRVRTGSYAGNVWESPVGTRAMQFEHEGADVSYIAECGASFISNEVPWLPGQDGGIQSVSKPEVVVSSVYEGDQFRVEVKPLVGDDYPAILRAMKAVKGTHLLVGEYTGVGATWEQVVKVFRMSNIVATTVEAVEQTRLPEEVLRTSASVPTATAAEAIVESEFLAIAK